LLLDFLSGPLDSRITFTRASTATFFNSAGTLTSASNDVARFDYNPATLAAQGLLIEESRTNLLLQSEDFTTTWTTSNASITANSTTAPTGTSVADTLVENTANSEHYVQQAYTVGANAAFSFSVYAKAAGRTVLRLFALGDRYGGTAQAFVFNLSAVTATNNNGTSTGTITAAGNGWFRCVINLPTTTTTGSLTLRAVLQDGANATYTGDGTSGLFLFGAQLEAGAFPTSYIPTTTTALTRAADVASVNTLTPWYNQTQGTMYAEVLSAPANTIVQVAYELNDNLGGGLGRIFTRRGTIGTVSTAFVDGGSAQADIASLASIAGSATYKVASAYAANDFALSLNGAAVIGDLSGTVPNTIARLFLGQNYANGQVLNGYLRRITYYPRRLANAELQSITL
jgi:hypothetical protein